jgi:hypothetical protein
LSSHCLIVTLDLPFVMYNPPNTEFFSMISLPLATMPFSIDTFLATDVPACVQIYFDSFKNSHSLACWPRVHTIRAF